MPQHVFGARLVHARIELESPTFLRFFYGPAGEYAGDFGHIFLGITAVDSERVQFHQLAAVILVESAALSLAFRCRGLPSRAV